MSHNLNSLKGILLGSSIGVIKGDTRSVDYSSYGTHDVENSLGLEMQDPQVFQQSSQNFLSRIRPD